MTINTWLDLCLLPAEVSYWRDAAQLELADAINQETNTNEARNVILFVGDGMGMSTVTAARVLKGQQRGKTGEEERLTFERFPHLGLAKVSEYVHVRTCGVYLYVYIWAGWCACRCCKCVSNFGKVVGVVSLLFM